MEKTSIRREDANGYAVMELVLLCQQRFFRHLARKTGFSINQFDGSDWRLAE
jgi:hypothetical protein